MKQILITMLMLVQGAVNADAQLRTVERLNQ